MNGEKHRLRIKRIISHEYEIVIDVEADSREEAIQKFNQGSVVVPSQQDSNWKPTFNWIEDEYVVHDED